MKSSKVYRKQSDVKKIRDRLAEVRKNFKPQYKAFFFLFFFFSWWALYTEAYIDQGGNVIKLTDFTESLSALC